MQRQLRVTVDGHVYDVTVEDLTDTGNQLYPAPNTMSAHNVLNPVAAAAPAPVPAPAAAGEDAVVSSMSGVLVELLVAVGDEVEAGQIVATIEAMKMKTPLTVERSGTVASIELSAGAAVQAGQTILTLS